MRIIVTLLILIMNLSFQSTLLQAIRIRSILPNTSIIIIVSFALLRGSFEGAMVGFVNGLLLDIFFGNSIGFYSFLGLIMGYLIGKVHKEFYRENYLLPLMLSALSTFIYGVAIYFTGFLFKGNLNFLYILINKILPETVYTSVLSMVIYRVLYGINNFIESKEKRNRKMF